MLNFDSPLTAFKHWEKTIAARPFLRQYINNDILEYTFKESGDEIRRIANALLSLKLPEKSKIALLSKNCAHWVMSDIAIMMAGHVSVPIYPTLQADTIQHILEHSESKAIIIGKLDNFESQRKGIPDIHKISIELYGIREGISWETLLTQHKPIKETVKLDPEDLITIIYTSGTTGNPKGVMHTVANFANSSNTILKVLSLPDHPRFFSFLPMSHVAERIGIEIGGIYRGATITFPESLETFATNLADTQPNIFFAVPRIWAKFQEKILDSIPQKKLNNLISIPFVGNLVKKKIRKKLGLSQAQLIISGAAPLSVSLMQWYKKMGITILQGYGMTEDCIISHFNLPGDNRVGTVGKSLQGVSAKLSPEGEICIKNNCLTKGYYKSPEETAKVFDKDGYLKTGDIGEYDHEGYLTITGRVKDQFKTDKGKYISPAPIELELSKNPNIELLCIVGMGIPQPIALIVPSAEAKETFRPDLIENLSSSIKSVNTSLEKHEKIEKVIVMKEDWTIENGLLTPTLKVKRNQVEKIHMPMYKSWFDSNEKVIFEE